MSDLIAPPRRRNVLSRFLHTLHLLPRPEAPPPPLCVCGHPPHGIEPHMKPFLPRSPPEPEFEDWPEDTSEVEYPVPAYSPPRVSPMYRHVRYEVVGPTPAPWTEAAESWVACERAHDRESVWGGQRVNEGVEVVADDRLPHQGPFRHAQTRILSSLARREDHIRTHQGQVRSRYLQALGSGSRVSRVRAAVHF